MIRVILCGSCGRMGKAVTALARESDSVRIVLGVDPSLGTSFADAHEAADVVIDFSTPAALDDILGYCAGNGVPLVLATTGHGEGAQEKLNKAAESTAILKSANLSYGAYVLRELSARARELLGSAYDVSIVETHHKAKKDAPSGTAKQLAEGMGLVDMPMFSVRGGGIVGTHEVSFHGVLDGLSLKHEALDRQLFARGALDAAEWIVGCAPGLYQMEDYVALALRKGD